MVPNSDKVQLGTPATKPPNSGRPQTPPKAPWVEEMKPDDREAKYSSRKVMYSWLNQPVLTYQLLFFVGFGYKTSCFMWWMDESDESSSQEIKSPGKLNDWHFYI